MRQVCARGMWAVCLFLSSRRHPRRRVSSCLKAGGPGLDTRLRGYRRTLKVIAHTNIRTGATLPVLIG